MKAITLLEFRKHAEDILRRVGKGERFVLFTSWSSCRPAGANQRLPFHPTRQAIVFENQPTSCPESQGQNAARLVFLSCWMLHNRAAPLQSGLAHKKRRFLTTDYFEIVQLKNELKKLL